MVAVATLGWANAQTVEAHLKALMNKLKEGRNILKTINTHTMETYNIPDVEPDSDSSARQPPRDNDK